MKSFREARPQELESRRHSAAALTEAWIEPGDLSAAQLRIAREAREIFGADICAIFALNPITGEFSSAPILSGDLRGSGNLVSEPPRPDGFTRKVLREGQLFIENLAESPQWKSVFSEEEGIRAFAALPLGAQPRPEPFAVLYIDFREPRRFDAAAREEFADFAEKASSLLQHTWLLNRYRAVIRIGQDINQGLDVEELFRKLDEHVSAILDTSCFFMLAVYFDQIGTMDLYSKQDGAFKVEKNHPLTAGFRKVIEERRTLAIASYSEDARAHRLPVLDELDAQDLKTPQSLIFVPLLLRDMPLGVLSVQHLEPRAYDQEDLHILEILANHVASALNSIRLFEDLELLNKKQKSRTEQEFAILREIDIELGRTTDLAAVLQTILTGARELIQAEHASILLVNPATNQLQVLAAAGHQAEELEHSQPAIDPGKGITRWAFENRQPVRVGDAPNDPRYLDIVRNVLSELDVPLLEPDGAAIGVINFESPRPNAFTDADQRFARTLAGQVVVAVKKAQIYEVAESRLSEQAKLIEITRQMIGQLDLQALLEQILMSAIETTLATAGTLLLYDDKRQELEIRKEWGTVVDNNSRRIPIDRGIVGLAARERSMLNIDPSEPFWADIYLPRVTGGRSELAVPLLGGDRLWGVLNLESTAPWKFRDVAVWRLVAGFADMAVVALQNAERYQEAKADRERMEALQEVSQEIVRQSTDPDKVMKAIVIHALKLTSSDEGDLDLYEKGKAVKTYYFNVGAKPAPIVEEIDLTAEDAPSLPRGIIEHVAATRTSYWTEVDAQDDALYAGNATTRSEIAVPLLDGDELIGVLNIDNLKPHAFDKKDAEFLELFAAEAVIAIQNARSHARAERDLARFRSLFETGQKLGEISEVRQRAEACEIVTAQAVAQCGGDGLAVVRAYDETARELVLVNASGSSEVEPFERMKLTEGINGHVYQHRETVRIDDVRNPRVDEPVAKLSNPSTRSLLITPIMLRDFYYGNLGLSHVEPRRFTREDQDLIEGLAKLLAITFHRLDAIQKEKDLQEQAKQNEVMGWIGEASYSLAHRLNNDMGLIRTYVNWVREALRLRNIDDPEVEENLRSIVKATSVVLNLSATLKEEVSTFKIEDPQPIRVEELFSDLAEYFRNFRKNVKLSFKIEAGIGTIHAVASQVADILRNLIINAFEAMPEGGWVRVSAKNHEGQVEIVVSDNGPGIAEKEHENIFRFLHSSSHKHGSGFGLWSAKRKSMANGGRLEVQSSLGEGATFILTLPRADQRMEVKFES
jgi:GAF domain-containing protein/anti-sigma regulatory factor (Ser/Thr protein kinase)